MFRSALIKGLFVIICFLDNLVPFLILVFAKIDLLKNFENFSDFLKFLFPLPNDKNTFSLLNLSSLSDS